VDTRNWTTADYAAHPRFMSRVESAGRKDLLSHVHSPVVVQPAPEQIAPTPVSTGTGDSSSGAATPEKKDESIFGKFDSDSSKKQ
jgi:hypothetical protein